MYNDDRQNSHISVLGDQVRKPKKEVYLEGAQSRYATPSITKVAPAPYRQDLVRAFEKENPNGVIYELVKPMLMLQRVVGIFPIAATDGGPFKVVPHWLIYSLFCLLVIIGFIGYGKYDKIDMEKSAEGKFEEAVIEYLFTVYLVPILIIPLLCYESKKLAYVFNEWVTFEQIFEKVAQRKFAVYLGNKPLVLTIALPVFSCTTMVITHVTMGYFKFLHVIPFCYINTVTFLVGGLWFLYCDVIGKTGLLVSEEFEEALKNIGPSSKVADFRALWMLLSRLTRDTANAISYTLIFLCLYLFLVITLTIYGLLSQIQEGFGIKDIGLTITALCAVALLFFICDEAHYASNCVKVQFQKKILVVELSWMNDEAQQEINMFLRATEMNPTEMSVAGFFDVNRNLFKSLIATMVTYLVVLLQFQISIPEDSGAAGNATITTVPTPAPQK